jgi:hypothetical protein
MIRAALEALHAKWRLWDSIKVSPPLWTAHHNVHFQKNSDQEVTPVLDIFVDNYREYGIQIQIPAILQSQSRPPVSKDTLKEVMRAQRVVCIMMFSFPPRRLLTFRWSISANSSATTKRHATTFMIIWCECCDKMHALWFPFNRRPTQNNVVRFISLCFRLPTDHLLFLRQSELDILLASDQKKTRQEPLCWFTPLFVLTSRSSAEIKWRWSLYRFPLLEGWQ